MADLVCSRCGVAVPAHVDRCVGCGVDVGFPNVRAASRPREVDALARRYEDAVRDASARGVEPSVRSLEERLGRSEAVICKAWGILNTLVLRDSRLLQTFHQEIASEGRLPENNEYDPARPGVDATFFPFYHEAMRFAALSIDGKGSLAYGGGCMVLRESSIAERSTVFEENTLVFARKHRLTAGDAPPPGSTAVWSSRAKLGIAKLAGRVEDGMSETDFASLVLTQGGQTSGDDFLEVHIYGPIHRSAISRLTGNLPKNRADRLMVTQLQRDLAAAGVEMVLTA